MSKKQEIVVQEENAVSLFNESEFNESLAELQESLESIDKPNFPIIRCKDGKFIESEGSEGVDTIEGVLLYAKNSNAFFKGKYKAGESSAPDCYSLDGREPHGDKPEAKSCKECPRNQFKEDGSGKDCRNTKAVFILVGDALMPKLLRVPPTSLKYINRYIMDCAADVASYKNVTTKVSFFKAEEAQSYYNLKFTRGKPLPKELKSRNHKFMDLWGNIMKGFDTGVDDNIEVEQQAEEAQSETHLEF